MNKHIVYIVHGPQCYYDAAYFSLLTLFHLLESADSKHYKVWVWTPRPDKMPQHPAVVYRPITENRLRLMKGPLCFVHRIKLALLVEVARTIRNHFVFVDVDTRWLELPDTEFDRLHSESGSGHNLFFMNGVDGVLSEQFKAGYYRYLTDNYSQLKAAFDIIGPPWHIWNSGVLGMTHQASEGLLVDSLALCDALVPCLKPRIYVEQLALDLIVPARCKVESFKRPIDHYWDCSFEAYIYLRKFFAMLSKNQVLSEQAELAFNLPWHRETFRSMQKAPRYRLLRWHHRLRASFGKRIVDWRARRLLGAANRAAKQI